MEGKERKEKMDKKIRGGALNDNGDKGEGDPSADVFLGLFENVYGDDPDVSIARTAVVMSQYSCCGTFTDVVHPDTDYVANIVLAHDKPAAFGLITTMPSSIAEEPCELRGLLHRISVHTKARNLLSRLVFYALPACVTMVGKTRSSDNL